MVAVIIVSSGVAPTWARHIASAASLHVVGPKSMYHVALSSEMYGKEANTSNALLYAREGGAPGTPLDQDHPEAHHFNGWHFR